MFDTTGPCTSFPSTSAHIKPAPAGSTFNPGLVIEVECVEGASLIAGELQITCDTGSQWEYGESGHPICMPGNENSL